MGFTSYQYFLAALQITTGSLNTLTTKWADSIDAKGRDGSEKEFKHPFVQACAMFLGEFLCLITFKIIYCILKRRNNGSEDRNSLTKGNREFNPFILYIPAICDMIATSLMYIGLALTFASSFQMLRGAVIIFVAFLSVIFLRRHILIREWIGIVAIVCGLVLVGVADMMTNTTNSNYSRNNIITGDLLILMAQIIVAIQMVFEEKFVAGMDIPALYAVGYEGLFGFLTLGILLIPFYYIKVDAIFAANGHGSLEDVIDAAYQIKNSPYLQLALAGTVISIAFFNFAGISITKEISATSRMVLDSVRTMIIWIVSISLKMQPFQPLQLVGFSFLLIGMCIYNNILITPLQNIFIRCRTDDNTAADTNYSRMDDA